MHRHRVRDVADRWNNRHLRRMIAVGELNNLYAIDGRFPGCVIGGFRHNGNEEHPSEALHGCESSSFKSRCVSRWQHQQGPGSYWRMEQISHQYVTMNFLPSFSTCTACVYEGSTWKWSALVKCPRISNSIPASRLSCSTCSVAPSPVSATNLWSAVSMAGGWFSRCTSFPCSVAAGVSTELGESARQAQAKITQVASRSIFSF